MWTWRRLNLRPRMCLMMLARATSLVGTSMGGMLTFTCGNTPSDLVCPLIVKLVGSANPYIPSQDKRYRSLMPDSPQQQRPRRLSSTRLVATRRWCCSRSGRAHFSAWATWVALRSSLAPTGASSEPLSSELFVAH